MKRTMTVIEKDIVTVIEKAETETEIAIETVKGIKTGTRIEIATSMTIDELVTRLAKEKVGIAEIEKA